MGTGNFCKLVARPALRTVELAARALQVQRKQVLENLLVRYVRRPPIGGIDRRIEPGVGVRKPRRTSVVQVRERPLLQLRLARPLGVQPAATQLVQALVRGGLLSCRYRAI